MTVGMGAKGWEPRSGGAGGLGGAGKGTWFGGGGDLR